MNCPSDQHLLDDYLDGSLDELARQGVEAHVKGCVHCRNALNEERAVRAALRGMPIEPPNPAFAARALRRTAMHHTGRKAAFAGGFATAIAATLVIWFAVAPLMHVATPETPGIFLTLDQPREVRLVFSTAQALESATMVMRLPENIEVQGHPGARELRWETSLASGRNLLVLPLVAHEPGETEIVAQLIHGSETKEFRLRVGVGTARPKDHNINI